MADIIRYTVIAHSLKGTSSHMASFRNKVDAQRRVSSLYENGHAVSDVTIMRDITCGCGFTHELGRSDTTCCHCGQDYNCVGDKLRSHHCSDEHYEAAEYRNG